MYKRTNTGGFTLLELGVMVLIIVMLMAMIGGVALAYLGASKIIASAFALSGGVAVIANIVLAAAMLFVVHKLWQRTLTYLGVPQMIREYKQKLRSDTNSSKPTKRI